jgi:hypothetical protein
MARLNVNRKQIDALKFSTHGTIEGTEGIAVKQKALL